MAVSDPLDAWDYVLPNDRIARRPAEHRRDSRLLVVPIDQDTVHDRLFPDLRDLLRPGDPLVANNTRVMHARLGILRHLMRSR